MNLKSAIKIIKLFQEIVMKVKDIFMKTPKVMQFYACLSLILFVLCGYFLVSCQHYTGEVYSNKMVERSSKHFPKYISLIQSANKKQLGEAIHQDKAYYKDLSVNLFDDYKNVLVRAIKKWQNYIIVYDQLITKEVNKG